MTTPSVPICKQHNAAKEWRATTFEHVENGISIRIPNIYAWVCPTDGEASFTPETVDQLIATARARATACVDGVYGIGGVKCTAYCVVRDDRSAGIPMPHGGQERSPALSHRGRTFLMEAPLARWYNLVGTRL